MIYIGSDHAGVSLKKEIKKLLDMKKMKYEDLSEVNRKDDDYPDYAFKVAEKVARRKGSKGILICGSGSGMEIAANKVSGARAAVIYDSYSAKMAVNDDDANIACLRGRKFSKEQAKKVILVFLGTKFSALKRHKRRVGKISRYEKKRKV